MIRRRVRAIVLVVAGALLAAACSSQADAPASSVAPDPTTTSTAAAATTTTTVPATTTTTLAPRTVGLDWTNQKLDIPTSFRFLDIEEALGQLWIVGSVDLVPMLLVSPDGETWEEVDPGWNDRLFQIDVRGDRTPILLSGTDTTLTMVSFFGFEDGKRAEDGRNGELWIYENDGSAWTVRGPQETGLDVMPPGKQRFRIKGLTSIAREADTVVAVGVTQWWLPYKTSDFSFVSIASLPDGQWKVFGDESRLFGTAAWQTPVGIVTADGLFVSAGQSNELGDGTPDLFAAWTSPDGVDWTALEPEAAPDGLDSIVMSVASTPAGVLAAGYEEPPSFPIIENDPRIQKPVVWFSPDGTSWTRKVLAEEEGLAEAILTVGDTIYVLGHLGIDPTVWVSTDGSTFEVVDGAWVPSFVGDQSTTSWRDGLAGVLASRLYLSLP